MSLLDFTARAPGMNAAVFTVSAVLVWAAGTRLAGYADRITRRLAVSQAVTGVLLLAFISSLPEFAVCTTAAVAGNAALGLNNLLGGVAMQVAILAIADALIGREALTSVIADANVLLQVTFNVVLYTLVALAIASTDTAWFGVGAWCWGILAAYIAGIWTITRFQGQKVWVAAGRGGRPTEPVRAETRAQASAQAAAEPPAGQGPGTDRSFTPAGLAWRTGLAAAVILTAGFLVTRSGEVLADQIGLGQSLGGYTLLAVSTSLPELSTALASVRLGRNVMAVSDIFGTNLFHAALIFLLDVIYAGEPVLNEVGRFSLIAALLAVVVTAVFLVGLIERRDRTILRMGWDSMAVLGVYAAGLLLLFRVR